MLQITKDAYGGLILNKPKFKINNSFSLIIH